MLKMKTSEQNAKERLRQQGEEEEATSSPLLRQREEEATSSRLLLICNVRRGRITPDRDRQGRDNTGSGHKVLPLSLSFSFSLAATKLIPPAREDDASSSPHLWRSTREDSARSGSLREGDARSGHEVLPLLLPLSLSFSFTLAAAKLIPPSSEQRQSKSTVIYLFRGDNEAKTTPINGTTR
ncbi:hypothetical protein BHE74_00016378 [Ensete ventricosum]|nr:hypothetical protein BHE74_00016378 [Ensete ventricosum]